MNYSESTGTVSRGFSLGFSLRPTERGVLSWLTLGTVSWLVVIPIVLVVYCSFQLEPLAHIGAFTLHNYL